MLLIKEGPEVSLDYKASCLNNYVNVSSGKIPSNIAIMPIDLPSSKFHLFSLCHSPGTTTLDCVILKPWFQWLTLGNESFLSKQQTKA